MAENQPSSKPSASKQDASKQDAAKSDPPKEKPEKRAEVDANTAANNRSAFFKNS